MNIFERASRASLRFQSQKGSLTTEDLWSLKLEDLNKIAVSVHKELQQAAGISFIDDQSPNTAVMQLRMDILKHVIESKKSDAQAVKTRRENEARKEFIQEVLNKKKQDALMGMSVEELQRQLENMEG